MAASTALQMGTQYQQGKQQESAYKAQAQAARQNAGMESHRAERIAESYAQKQHQLNDKYKLAVGNARAQFGASGLDSTGGSLEDVLSSSSEAYNRDSQNLLSNQREDTWASYVKQVNSINEMNAYNQMAHNTKKQNLWSMAGTLLSGASSIYGQGYKEGVWGGSGKKIATPKTSAFGGYNFGSMYNEGVDYRP